LAAVLIDHWAIRSDISTPSVAYSTMAS
jgi:hypothetical protein